MDIEKMIRFLREQQARFDARQAELDARQAELDARQAEFDTRQAEFVVLHAKFDERFEEGMVQINDVLLRIASAQERTSAILATGYSQG